MSSTLQTSLDRTIGRAITDQRIVGTVLLVSQGGDMVYRQAAGFANREANIPVREDTIFRFSSLSKPIVSATAMAMVDQGLLNLDDTVTKWIPEFQPSGPDGSKPEITLRQLLNHTAGLRYGFWEPEDGPYHQANVSDGLDQPDLSMEENLRRIASVPLAYQPGTSWGYSVSTDVAGAVIARACKCSLPEAVSRFLTAPLAMTDTGFTVTDPARLAVPYADASPRPVRMGDLQLIKMPYGPGSIRYAPARAFDTDSYPSGGCGMVGTAGDFSKFLEALRTGGNPILSAQSVHAMTSNQTGGLGPAPGTAFGFGLSVIVDPAAVPTPQSAGTLQWGGVYGHSWFVDAARQLSVVMLSNTALEGMIAFPAQIRTAIYGAL